MNDFIETIKGKSYSIEEAKQIFIDYTLRHKGIVNEKFKGVNVEIYQRCLPNGSKSYANTDIEQNKIRMVAGKNSIITFFHKLKHLADGWKDSKGILHTNWDYEDDLTAQMEWSNQQEKVI